MIRKTEISYVMPVYICRLCVRGYCLNRTARSEGCSLALNSDLGHSCIMNLDKKQTLVQKNRRSARTNQPFELKFLGDDLDRPDCIPATFGLHA